MVASDWDEGYGISSIDHTHASAPNTEHPILDPQYIGEFFLYKQPMFHLLTPCVVQVTIQQRQVAAAVAASVLRPVRKQRKMLIKAQAKQNRSAKVVSILTEEFCSLI